MYIIVTVTVRATVNVAKNSLTAIHQDQLFAVKSDVPESVHVEPVALLLTDNAETGASCRVVALAGAPAGRHLLVGEGDAHLTPEAVVAIPRRVINALIRGPGFRRRSAARK